MNADRRHHAFSWLASRAGRRYKLELTWVVFVKLVALTILYYAFIAPQPRTDLSPSALQQHLLDASPVVTVEASP
jgi:hypothetical protein